jgi:glycosyltransferase involved in cell wall biosynthesis
MPEALMDPPMLAIVTTHPIQYQVPLWQALATDGRVPFEVWYLTDHGTRLSLDREFGKTFAWDLEMLSGYPYNLLDVGPTASPNSFLPCRLRERLRDRIRRVGARVVWIQGWQVAAYWQAAWEAKAAGVELWLRGESNDLALVPRWKRPLKRLLLGQLFSRVDRFLYIGSANRRLYRSFGVCDSRLHPAPYAVDNNRFARQAAALRLERYSLRRAWRIPADAFCVLFCGKFIAKKRPMDVVTAVQKLRLNRKLRAVHLLFAGDGELSEGLRAACHVVYDHSRPNLQSHEFTSTSSDSVSAAPPASFVGFLNQTEICSAYIAADCLVLPSDHRETWGLVVNEALASSLPCVVSDACGCSEDFAAAIDPSLVFPCGDVTGLVEALTRVPDAKISKKKLTRFLTEHSVEATIETVASLTLQLSGGPPCTR